MQADKQAAEMSEDELDAALARKYGNDFNPWELAESAKDDPLIAEFLRRVATGR
jgi:hypothetical protein